jgi:NADH-quinone oxidoreductase subunit C
MPEREELLARLQSKFPDVTFEAPAGMIDFTIVLPAGALRDVALFLRDELGYDYLTDVTAVDWPDRFEVVYHLYGIQRMQGLLTLKVPLTDKAKPAVPSVVDIWKSADLHERECYDLMGIRFEGHPRLKRIMMWEGFEGHPLRKDYVNRTFTYAELEPSRQATEDW